MAGNNSEVYDKKPLRRCVLNVLYSCKSVAMKISMWYPDDHSY